MWLLRIIYNSYLWAYLLWIVKYASTMFLLFYLIEMLLWMFIFD